MRPPEYDAMLVEAIPMVRKFCLKACYYDKELAEDLVQDVLLRALSNPLKIQPGNNIYGWLYTIAHNLAVNSYVRNASSPVKRMELPDHGEIGSQEAASELQLVMARIGQMSPIKGQSLQLYLDGFLYKEIAEMLDVSINTVKTRIFLARAELQSYDRWEH